MHTIYSEHHRLHRPSLELCDGELVPAFEKPERADWVRQRIAERQLGPIAAPNNTDEASALGAAVRVHSPDYLDYLQHAWQNWSALGRTRDILPFCFPVREMRRTRPTHPDGLAGYYAMDAGAPITPGTWQAACSSVHCTLTALERIIVHHERSAFALCRPPGHHAGVDYAGGYCYLNNAAIAAQHLIDQGAARVAVLDVDYHHGNGTQQIFYERADVLCVSLHGDPSCEYPYFLGHAAEGGQGAGLDYNLNLPLPAGTDYTRYRQALDLGCAAVMTHAPDVLIVSLGVDTYKYDPISLFQLETTDYLRMGEHIAACGVPTLFVMEGGYAVADIGDNVANVLEGFAGRAS